MLASVVCLSQQTSASHVGRSLLRLVPNTRVVMFRHGSSTPPTVSSCLAASNGAKRCYTPADIQAAYDTAPLYQKGDNGTGETIVIVDAFGSPTIATDLAQFDTTFSLPAPPHFSVIQPVGTVSAFSGTAPDRLGWAIETTLDVEWAHAMAPGANILLVETPTDEVEGLSGFPDIIAAENYVITHHLGQIVTMSFGATEQTFPSVAKLTALRSAFLAGTSANVTFVSGSGDLGASNDTLKLTGYPYPVVAWPASDPLVTAVGGTKLTLDDAGNRLSPDTVWNDSTPGSPSASGGGLSTVFPRPAFQKSVSSVVGKHRGLPDIALSGACSGLVDIYVGLNIPTYPSGWYSVCGTSESSPLFAGVVAIADQVAGRSLGDVNPALYALALKPNNGLVPVTSGTNTVSVYTRAGLVTVPGFRASSSYNLASGLGTLDVSQFVPALVNATAHTN